MARYQAELIGFAVIAFSSIVWHALLVTRIAGECGFGDQWIAVMLFLMRTMDVDVAIVTARYCWPMLSPRRWLRALALRMLTFSASTAFWSINF